MRRLAAITFAVVACGKGKEETPPPAPAPKLADAAIAVDAAVVSDWARCEATLRAAPKVPATRRAQLVIDGCTPCGDWSPLLKWDTLETDGGPTRAQIEAAMLGCKAYCEPNAKQRFLGNLDAARGKGGRGPWKILGEICGPAVSAGTDGRYVSAPLFALDRIARAAGERADLAPLLDAFDFPLPAIASTGTGFSLASAPVTTPDAGPLALTVSMGEIRLTTVPHAKLGKDGVTVVSKGEPYPGALVKTSKDLEAAIKALAAGDPISVFAPSGMPASRLIDVMAIAPRHELRLAVAAEGAPIGWALAGTMPVALVPTFTNDKPPADATRFVLGEDPNAVIKEAKAMSAKLGHAQITVALTPQATIAHLAKFVGALAYFDVKAVALVKAKP